MSESKTGPTGPVFWCGILTGEKQAAAPSQARTVRGPYTASSLANSQRDKSDRTNGHGTTDGESKKQI